MYTEDILLLKTEVESFFGRKILNASDCQLLSADIFKETQSKISLNTLRRVFNLMKSDYNPSRFTLDVLSQYCGYSNFNEFLLIKRQTSEKPDHTDQGLLQFLMLIFKKTDVKEVNDQHFFNLIQEIIGHLDEWPIVIEPFQRFIAKTASGQKYYFEEFTNIDKLNSYYGQGLNYYLHEKKTPEGQIFGHSLLCFRYWLTGNNSALARHYEAMMKYKIDRNTNPFISGRYFASQLYYADVFELDTDRIMMHARDFYTSLNELKCFSQYFPGFEFMLTESLVLIHQPDEAQFYINEAIKKRNNHNPPHVDSRLLETIYLYQAIAHCLNGKLEKAKDILETISTENFYSLSKNYNTILYLIMKNRIHKNRFVEKQIGHLIKLTGFKRLTSITKVLA